MLLFSSNLLAQETVTQEKLDGAKLVSVSSVAVAEDTTIYSQWFTASDFIGQNMFTYKASYTKLQSSAANTTLYVTTLIQGSNDQSNIVTVDTVGTLEDSLKTLYTGTTALDKDTTYVKYFYYRFALIGGASNPSDAVVDVLNLLFTKPKN